MFVFARYERDLWLRVSYTSSGYVNWWVEEFSRGIRFSRNITVILSVMLVQGEPIGGFRSSHEICVLV